MATICGIKKCCNGFCRFYTGDLDNHCMALQEVYLDDSKCPFFKPRETKETTEKTSVFKSKRR